MINNHPLITILLPTYNCASIIKRTLDSISWADEIIVVDSYSDDSTCNIALEYGAKIFQHEYINSAKQKNWLKTILPIQRHFSELWPYGSKLLSLFPRHKLR